MVNACVAEELRDGRQAVSHNEYARYNARADVLATSGAGTDPRWPK
jgi:hypothetical protein